MFKFRKSGSCHEAECIIAYVRVFLEEKGWKCQK